MLPLALVIIAATIVLMVRRVEVRLVLLGGGIALALLAGRPLLPCDVFTRAMVTAMVAPICASMGFAAIMAKTRCNRQLVTLLLAPIRRVRWLVIPGGILAAYLVNVAVPSHGRQGWRRLTASPDPDARRASIALGGRNAGRHRFAPDAGRV